MIHKKNIPVMFGDNLVGRAESFGDGRVEITLHNQDLIDVIGKDTFRDLSIGYGCVREKTAFGNTIIGPTPIPPHDFKVGDRLHDFEVGIDEDFQNYNRFRVVVHCTVHQSTAIMNLERREILMDKDAAKNLTKKMCDAHVNAWS